MATKKSNKRSGAGIAALAGAAAAAAAAGYYFYASKNAKQNRKIAAKWAGQMKQDVLREAKKLQNIDRASLAKVVDRAATTYKTVRSIDRNDLERAVRELKGNLTELAREAQGAVKSASKSAKKRPAAKKTAKKTRSSKK